MSRRTIWLDRLLVLLLGLGLAAAGAFAAAWQAGRISGAPDRITLPWVETSTGESWWPTALGAAGVVLILIGLRWLAAHAPHRRVHDVPLPGSDGSGRLEVDLSAVATAAADSVTGLGVHSCRGRAVQDRGRRIVELEVRLEPGASLSAASAAVDDCLAQLATAAGPDVTTRVRIRVGRASRRPQPRVA